MFYFREIIMLLIVTVMTIAGLSVIYVDRQKKSHCQLSFIDKLEGDFSFKDQWEYAEGIYHNRHGQLSCDGICPTEIDCMKDENGKIYPDSLAAFYAIIDTTHLYYSLKSTTNTYEYSGVNRINFIRKSDYTLTGISICNASTHTSLHIEIKQDYGNAWIHFNSIRDLGEHTFPLKTGTIQMDQQAYKDGIVKAKFDFTFTNTLDPVRELFWKGLIYSPIK